MENDPLDQEKYIDSLPESNLSKGLIWWEKRRWKVNVLSLCLYLVIDLSLVSNTPHFSIWSCFFTLLITNFGYSFAYLAEVVDVILFGEKFKIYRFRKYIFTLLSVLLPLISVGFVFN